MYSSKEMEEEMEELPECTLRDYCEWEINGRCLWNHPCDAQKRKKKRRHRWDV